MGDGNPKEECIVVGRKKLKSHTEEIFLMLTIASVFVFVCPIFVFPLCQQEYLTGMEDPKVVEILKKRNFDEVKQALELIDKPELASSIKGRDVESIKEALEILDLPDVME